MSRFHEIDRGQAASSQKFDSSNALAEVHETLSKAQRQHPHHQETAPKVIHRPDGANIYELPNGSCGPSPGRLWWHCDENGYAIKGNIWP